MMYEIDQHNFGFECFFFFTVTQSNWWVVKSLEKELHLRAPLVLINPAFAASFVGVWVLVCLYFRQQCHKQKVKTPQCEGHCTSGGFSDAKCTNYGTEEEGGNWSTLLWYWPCQLTEHNVTSTQQIVKCKTSKGVVGSFISILRLVGSTTFAHWWRDWQSMSCSIMFFSILLKHPININWPVHGIGTNLSFQKSI